MPIEHVEEKPSKQTSSECPDERRPARDVERLRQGAEEKQAYLSERNDLLDEVDRDRIHPYYAEIEAPSLPSLDVNHPVKHSEQHERYSPREQGIRA